MKSLQKQITQTLDRALHSSYAFRKVSMYSRSLHSIRDIPTWDPAIQGLDPLFYADSFNDEETAIQKNVALFCKQELMPEIKMMFRHSSPSQHILQKMGNAGLFAINSESPMTMMQYGIVAREIERVDSGFRSMFSVHSSLIMHPIMWYGSEYQKEKYLPGLEKGQLVGCFGLTEPNHGSDIFNMDTTAVIEGNDVILNGTKSWITNAPIADFSIVWAKLNGVVRGFLIDKDTQGFTTKTIEGKFSLRSTTTGEIILNSVRIPKSSMFPNIEGMKGPYQCLNLARLGIAWGALGAAEKCIEVARDYCITRHQFNKPLAQYQLIQLKLADCISELSAALAMVIRVSQLYDQNKIHPNHISLIKRNSCKKALMVARICRDMLGGNGILDDFHIIRHLLNLEAVNTYEGTEDVHGLILGRAITGFSAF